MVEDDCRTEDKQNAELLAPSGTSSSELPVSAASSPAHAVHTEPQSIDPPPAGDSPRITPDSRNPSNLSISSLNSRPRATTLNVPGLTRSKVSPDGRIASRDVGSKMVIVMVGLPARGKSYITNKLARFFNWQQHNCRIFNVGNTRRKADSTVGPSQAPLPDGNVNTTHDGDFFSPDNEATVSLREKWALDTLNQLLDFVLIENGSVGILDATNSTAARRRMVLNRIKERSQGQLKVLFLESICTRTEIIEANVRLKLSGPDYKHMDPQLAVHDFLLRLRNYEKAYQTIGPEEEQDPDFQYVKMINVGQKVECGNIKGFLAGQAVSFLLNLNLAERQIWITRHGESLDNEKGRIGGDAGLTERGRKFSEALTRFLRQQRKEFRQRQLEKYTEQVSILRNRGSKPSTPLSDPEDLNFCVWTSMLRRAVETGEYFDDEEFDVKAMRMLNALDCGVCDGMTYPEIKEKYPAEYQARVKDKLRYRYPGVGGESYLDLINRLRPIIVEMERLQDHCVVISHRVVSRILLAYFLNLGTDAIVNLEVPLHTVFLVEPKPYGVDWAIYKYSEKHNSFYKVPKDLTNVKNQLGNQKRRYTVLPTAGRELGGYRPPESPKPDDSVAISSSDEESDYEELSNAIEDAMRPRSRPCTSRRVDKPFVLLSSSKETSSTNSSVDDITNMLDSRQTTPLMTAQSLLRAIGEASPSDNS